MTIIIHIKCLRSNFFIIISNIVGEILFTKTTGSLGFNNIQKRTKDAFSDLLLSASQYVSRLSGNVKVFLKIEGAIKNLLFKQINFKMLQFFKKHNICLIGLRVINKISHNGCRKSIRRK
jgi:ribosomal protein S11